MSRIDPAKQDMSIDYGERSFALRAFREDGSWHSVITENKTSLRNTLPPTVDAAKCFAEAVAFMTAAVDAARHDASAVHRGRHLDPADGQQDARTSGVRETESSG